MQIYVFVAKCAEGPPWIVGAWDEFSVDENPDGFAGDLARAREMRSAAEIRVAIVTVRDRFMHDVFATHTEPALTDEPQPDKEP